ncbi:ABC transporter permease [Rhodovibrio salinarum]|uniref:ABC transporter permease n=1 Tax=Rhodovibrio salinarum TaxID=1087 RepID=A0A934UYU8_9PROT|nr:ABC transporter permease [Rhodovibrio salinarum]MBK1696148.1 ABC transporter permease [Rhodovibrio salinarum]
MAYGSKTSALSRLAGNGAAIIALVYVVLFSIYAVSEPTALSLFSITNLVNNFVPLALAAAGQTLIVLLAGFDLSVAGVISLTNVVLAVTPLEGPLGALAGLAIALAIGGVAGSINGLLVAYLRIQSIAATLGTMIVLKGVALLILSAPGGWISDWIVYELTDVAFGLVPISGLILLAVAGVWLALKRTDFGAAIYAVGEDETSASLSGINTRLTKFKSYCLAGMFYGLAGYMLSAQTATGNPNAGEPFLLLCFASVAIGGTSFSGGRGGMIGSIIGAATLLLMQKVLFSTGVSSFYTGMFQGAVMIAAVVFAAAMLRVSIRKGAA